jgi:8-oxo-dGTP pyrophosphatase MutT (NUDIX family)
VPPEDRVADPGHGFAHLGDEERYRGWRISVVDGRFTAPDGAEFHRDIVRHPGAVAVVPMTDRGTVLLVRQYRGAVDRWLLEIPAGTRDVEHEAPEKTAGRELEEETGMRAEHLELLTVIYNTPGFCDEEALLYLASGLTPVPHARHGHEEQYIELVEVSLDDLDAMIERGELTDAQTLVGLFLARDRLGTGTSPATDTAHSPEH